MPTVTFEIYMQNTVLFGELIRGRHRMKLCMNDWDNKSFCFLAKEGHFQELGRLFRLSGENNVQALFEISFLFYLKNIHGEK